MLRFPVILIVAAAMSDPAHRALRRVAGAGPQGRPGGEPARSTCKPPGPFRATAGSEIKFESFAPRFDSSPAGASLTRSSPGHGGARFTGAAACAASGCHGAEKGGSYRGAEYSIWIEDDPHARDVLRLTKARRMMEIGGLAGNAWEHERCLPCHVTSHEPQSTVPGHALVLEDAVSCESCHGPAEKWLARHFRTDWRSLSGVERAALGFRSGRHDLVGRIEQCADCHVGAPGRDVDHDLIAAGHPRLNFEMSSHLARLPRHWSRRGNPLVLPANGNETAQTNSRRKRENGVTPSLARRVSVASGRGQNIDNESTLWFLGQVVAAARASEQLARRSRDSRAAWPEFSEHGCYACHHDLSGVQSAAIIGDGRNWPPFELSNWYSGTIRMLASDPALGPRSPDATARLDRALEELQEGMRQPDTARHEIGDAAGRLAAELRGWSAGIAALPFDSTDLGRALHASLGRRDAALTDWDAAAQVYLLAGALYAARRDEFQAGDANNEALRRHLKKSVSALRFPRDANSPVHWHPDPAERVLHEIQEIDRLFEE